jgi:hypothetical protein
LSRLGRVLEGFFVVGAWRDVDEEKRRERDTRHEGGILGACGG